jgi:hypothetical protein
MTHCKSVPTPLAVSEKLSVHAGRPLNVEKSAKYRNIIDALQYVTLTRLDIVYSVNKMCQFLHAPTIEHLTAVKRILRYLKYTIDTGIRFVKVGSLLVSAFSDSDWAEDSDDRRSIRGFAVYLGKNLVSWSACK